MIEDKVFLDETKVSYETSKNKNDKNDILKILADHSKEFAAFTMEIFEEVSTGFNDTLSSVAQSVSINRERAVLNEIVQNTLQSIDALKESDFIDKNYSYWSEW